MQRRRTPCEHPAQKDWLILTLKGIAQKRVRGPRKALLVATHHPPYSNGGHEPSVVIGKDLDAACGQAGVMPDVSLSAHAHNYQQYTRRINFGGRPLEIPYLVVGTAGRGIQHVPAATGQVQEEVTYDKSARGSHLDLLGDQLNSDSLHILPIRL